MCYYFNNLNRFEDLNLDNILINENLNENILFYNISYKNLISTKPLRIRFDKIDEYVRVYDGIKN